ncbi:MAG TPA: hypothetical protein VFP56_05515 [Candidatus Limnocylindrales bacterium]|nr:hypothetical protein [Candidatus Limnocylindrales bacterium]
MPKLIAKPEDDWRAARLIPTTGIGGSDEQEQRATSSLLAVMGAVPQFGRALLDHLAAPAGKSTFTEIRFIDADTRARPTGVVCQGAEAACRSWCDLTDRLASASAVYERRSGLRRRARAEGIENSNVAHLMSLK